MAKATCSIPDCTKDALARGWCGMHWKRWKDHGDPNWHPPTLMERVWSRVRKEPDGCWLWTAGRTSEGYGQVHRGHTIHLADPEYQCARCGSTLVFEDCQLCPATGWWDDNDPNCPVCHGNGTEPVCVSDHDWCWANPLPGRENVTRSTVEVINESA